MSVLTPQVCRPYVVNSLCSGLYVNSLWGVGWEGAPCSPDLALPQRLQVMGPPARARLCKTEARLGEAPGERPLGTGWPSSPT